MLHQLVLIMTGVLGTEFFFSILQESKITREEMVRKMMIIVGKEILLEALDKLHYCVSL